MESAATLIEDTFLWASAFLSVTLIGRALSVPLTQLVLRLKFDGETKADDDPILKLRRETVVDRLVGLAQVTVGLVLQVVRAVIQLLLGNVGLLILVGTLLLLSIFSNAYGFDALHSCLSAWNTVIGPAVGLLKKVVAALLTSVQVILPLWNAVVLITQGLFKIALSQVGGCSALAVAKAGEEFALGIADIAVQLALLISRAFGGEMQLTSGFQHLGNSVLYGADTIHCTCSPLSGLVNLTTAPLNTPALYEAGSNLTNALLFPLEGVSALLLLRAPQFEARFFNAEWAVLKGGEVTNYWLQSICKYVVEGSTWQDPAHPIEYVPNFDFPLPLVPPKPQLVVPSGSMETATAIVVGGGKATATALAASIDFVRVLYNLITNLQVQWAKTATIAQRKELFNLDRPFGLLKDSVYIANNATLFMVHNVGWAPLRRLPALSRDVWLLELGAVHYAWDLGVGITFAIESSVKKSSGMLFVKGFEDTRLKFQGEVVLPALELAWSASRVVGGPNYVLGPVVYYSLATVTQTVNTSANLIYCTVSLFEDTQNSEVTADMFATVFDPVYEAVSQLLEAIISLIGPYPILYEAASCFGTSASEESHTYAVDMDPIPEAFWSGVNCMESDLCDLTCAQEHTTWTLAMVPDTDPGVSCGTSTCDPLKSCLGCNPACEAACNLARSCRVTRCYSTRVNLIWGGCQIGQTVAEILQTAVATFRGLIRMVIFDIEAGVRGKDPPRAWPTSTLKSVSCGLYHTTASLGAAVPSTFWGVLSGGGQFGAGSRGKNMLFAVSQFCAAITTAPAVYVNSVLDTIIKIFEVVGEGDNVGEVIEGIAKSPLMLVETVFKASLVEGEAICLGLFQVADAAVGKPSCAHSSSSVVECPQLSLITFANCFQDLQKFLPQITRLIYDASNFWIRLLLAIVMPSEANQRAFVSAFTTMFEEFEHILVMLAKLIETLVLHSQLGKEIVHLMVETVCHGIIAGWNDL